MINSIIKKCPWCNTDTGLLVLRIGVGGIFIFSGWMKVSNLTFTVNAFGSMGFVPFWAYLVTAVELLGGIAVLLGVCVRIPAALLAITMAVATYVVHSNIQIVFMPVSLMFSSLALFLAGSGKYSLVREK